MANHKKRRAKNQRAGCLLCKPWKSNGAPKEGGTYHCSHFHKWSDQKRRVFAAREAKEYLKYIVDKRFEVW